ncbi:MAG: hypothetical protein ACLUFV_02340 [Acutalibacteraceae bacterium]
MAAPARRCGARRRRTGLRRRHDFRSCMASGSKITDTVRRVFRFRVRREDEFVTMTVAADGFLYNMVPLWPARCCARALRRKNHAHSGRARADRPARRAAGLYLSAFFTRTAF